MYQAFMNLAEDKRQAIINAALKEFSINHYATASTNKIVSNANISKGILFHYFGSKKIYIYFYMNIQPIHSPKRLIVNLI